MGAQALLTRRRRSAPSLAWPLRFLRPSVLIPGLAGIGLFVLAWQLVAAHNRYVIPTVGAIARQLWDNPHLYFVNFLATLREMAVGLAVSFGVAFFLANVMIHIKALERAVMPLAVIINVTPIVAISPALAVAFGFGPTPKYVVTAIVVFFPLLVNCLVGLRSIDKEVLDVFKSLHASTFEVLWRLRLPNSLPFIFAGLRIALPLSIVGAVVAEFLVSSTTTQGLGTLILAAQASSNLVQIYAAAVVLAALGILLTLIVTACERSLLAWHPSMEGRR